MKRCPTCGVVSENLDLHEGERCKSDNSESSNAAGQDGTLKGGSLPKSKLLNPGPVAPSEKLQPFPTWDEVDAIRKGKSDIDLAEEIWQFERELAAASLQLSALRSVNAAITSQSATAPIEPTEAMIEAGKDERMACFNDPELKVGEALRRIYKAMLAATDNRSADKGQG